MGFTLHATRTLVGNSGPFGIGGAIAGAWIAYAAVRMDRSRTAGFSPLPDGQQWPIHGGVYAVPMLAAMPAILWLGLLVAVDARSLIPVFGAGAAVVAIAWGLIRVWSDHRLVVGLLALAQEDEAGARQALQTLAQHPLATRRARKVARENLGRILLSAGELSSAAHWFSQIEGSASASAGLAVAQAGLGQIEAASHALEQARSSPGARAVQAEIDAARVLVLWRSEGPQAARELAERLDNPASGSLFRALAGHLRGDSTGEVSPLVAVLVRD